MAIRGLGTATTGTGAGTQSETGFVVDNVPWIQPEFAMANWTDLSSFEIGYGPNGTAGGHNTDVGAIYITTPLPSFARKTQFEQTVGNYAQVIEKLDTTGPINDNLAYRFTGYYDRANGWIHDNTGPNYGNIDRGGARVQLLGVGENFTDRLIFNYNKSDEYSYYGEGQATGVVAAPIGNSFLEYANGTYAATYFQTLQQRLGKPALTTNPYEPYLARPGTDPAQNATVTNELNYQIGSNTLTSISAFGYGDSIQNDCTDNQNLYIGTISCGMDTYVLQMSQELRYSSPKGEKLEWTFGLYSMYEDVWNKMHHWEFGPYAAQWYSTPAAVPGLGITLDTTARDVQIAPFGQTTYHFTDKFALTVGLRDNYDVRYGNTDYKANYVSGTPYSIADQTAALMKDYGIGPYVVPGQTNHHNGLTGIVNPQYQVTENILTYALAGHGDKAPAINTSAAPVYANGVLQLVTPLVTKPTESWDYEIGVKTNWFDGQFVSNINFYWNDLWNFQAAAVLPYTTSAGDLAYASYLSNVPHVRLRGVEVIERWDPPFIQGLDIHGSGSINDVRYVSYPTAPPPTDDTYAGGPSSVNESGQRFVGVPRYTFNIGLDYQHPAGQIFRGIGDWAQNHDGWTANSYTAFGYGNVAWFGRTPLTDALANYQYNQSAYSIVNMGVGIRTDDKNYTFTLWTKNLFNARPFTAFTVGSATTPAAVGLTTQGPRYFGATLLVTL
jgi:outer membrane receptor protein involved in Fe transport